MDDRTRLLTIAKEIFTWASDLPHLLNRMGVALRMHRLSIADRSVLAEVSKRISVLFERANQLLDGDGDLDELAEITDQLRQAVVKANIVLDRLRVPD